MDGNGERTISYIKIWFIIQLKQPFINRWPSGSRYLCGWSRWVVHQIQVTSEAAALEEVGSHYWLSNEKNMVV